MINSINFNKNIKNRNVYTKLITPLVFLTIMSIFFFIPIKISGLGIRIDDILILLCVPLIVLHIKYIKNEKYIYPILLFLSLVAMSMTYGYIVLDVPFSGGDINEFFRYSKILLFAILLGYIDIHKLSNMTFKVFYYGSFYLIFVGFMQYFDPLSIGKYFSLLYTSESQIYTAIEHSVRRVTVTGSGPNDGAILVSYFMLFNFFTFVFTNNKKYLVLFILLIPVLFFTQSRTVIIGMFFALSISFLLTKSFYAKKIFLTFLISIFIIILFPLFSYIVIGIQTALEGTNNSLLVRISHIETAYNLFVQSPFVGWGFAKSLYYDMRMDSEYLTIFYRFGIFGLLSSIWIIIMPVLYKKQFDKIKIIELKVYYYMLFAFSILGLFVMLTNSFITGYQTFLGFILLTVLSFRFLKQYKS